jgi:hypothetical protein
METLKSAIKKAVSNAGVEKALKQESAVFLIADLSVSIFVYVVFFYFFKT